jgi:PAS domain S-box-containing protein
LLERHSSSGDLPEFPRQQEQGKSLYPRLIKDDKDGEPQPSSAPPGSQLPGGAGRVEASAALEPFMRAALAAADLPLYIAGADGRLRFATPAFQAFLGPGGTADAGQSVNLMPPIADIYARLAAGEAELRLAQSFVVQGQLRHFMGRHRRIVDSAGLLSAVVGHYIDVSDQRRAEQRAVQLEERFDDMARSVSDWVWETDANMNLSYASLSIAKVLGFPPQVLKGKYLFGFGCFEDADTELRPLANLIAARIPFRNRRFLVKRPEGEQPCYVQLSGVPVFDDQSGQFSGYRGTGTDVTRSVMAEVERLEGRRALERAHEELKRKSEHLERALQQAEAAADAKSQFLARMSHELRTPLNAIIGFSETASLRIFGVMNDRYADYFNNILRAGRHLLTLIEDILDATRIDSGKLKIEPRAVRLKDLIDSASGFVELRAAAKEVRLEVVTVPESWYLWADPVRTQQILVNLLDNAIKFTAPGGRVDVDCTARPDGKIDVVVVDSGVGIPTEQLDLVFEHFHQVDPGSLQAGHGGLGLGLAISRQLARMMHGDIFVESDVGRGSRFTVRLPSAETAG